MRWMGRRGMSAVVAVLVAVSAAGADEPAGQGPAEGDREVFESLYGEKMRQASATADRADDAALAMQLFAAAKDPAVTPGLLALLCEQAGDLGGRSADGYGVAVEAMTYLMAEVPEAKEACLDKLVDLHQRQYRRATGYKRSAAGEALVGALLARMPAADGGGLRAAESDPDVDAGLHRRPAARPADSSDGRPGPVRAPRGGKKPLQNVRLARKSRRPTWRQNEPTDEVLPGGQY